MKLYKLRSIHDSASLRFAADAISTGKFWCSRFWKMNDPMEGVFFHDPEYEQQMQNVFSQKNEYVICSFCALNGIENPVMWGHYANGFKGIALEIEVDDQDQCIMPVEYLPNTMNFNGGEIRKTMTCKLDPWEYENEFRYIVSGEEGLHEIGTVTKVLFGMPYGHTDNNDEVYARSAEICEYEGRAKHLRAIAKKNRIDFATVEIVNGKVSFTNNA